MKQRINTEEIRETVNRIIINDIWKAFYDGVISMEQLEYELKLQSKSYMSGGEENV